MRVFFTPILAISMALLLTASAPAALFTLTAPTQDAFVSASAANSANNYGGAGALAVSGSARSKGEFDSVLQYNFAAAKASFDSTFGAGQWVIDGISLQLTAAAPGNSVFNGFGEGAGGTNINFAGQVGVSWMQNDSWTEGTGTPGAPTATGITYSTLSSFQSGADQSLGTFAFGGGTSGSFNWNLGLASSFVADAAAGNAVSLLMLPGDTTVGMVVDSRSFGTAAFRPILSVDAIAVPEPGTAGFAVCLALAAMGIRRRYRGRAV
jgi:hypothetical protein